MNCSLKRRILLNLFNILKDINQQIDDEVEVLVWQKEASLLNQNTAIKTIVSEIILLILLLFINPTYALIVLLLSLVLLPSLIYSVCSPVWFWHYDKRKNTLRLYKKTELIQEISCTNLALNMRPTGNHSVRWILVSPKIGDIETLLITDNLLLYGKNFDFFSETADRLAQYTGLRRTVDTF